jgi:hypothetical protein
MWENRCKVAVSGVGFSKVTRSAEVPLAAHALTAVKEAVADWAATVRHRRSGDLSGAAGDGRAEWTASRSCPSTA